MGKLINCIRGIVDMTGSEEAASMLKEPLNAWEDNVTFGTGVGRQLLTFIRPLMDAMFSDGGKRAAVLLDEGSRSLRLKLGGKELPREAMKIIDPRGKFLDPGEKVEDFYRADSEKRVDAFFEGKLHPDALQGPERLFIPIKAGIVDDLEAAAQYSPNPSLKPRKPFTINDDVKNPLIRHIQETQDARVHPYEFSNTFAKQMYVRGMLVKDPAAVSFSEWFGTMYPQIKKQAIFNPIMKEVVDLLPSMAPAEQVRMQMVLNRLSGQKTYFQKVFDGIVDWARADAGKPKLDFSPSAAYALGMSRAFYRGIMWANPGMALVNLTQMINVAAKQGPMRTMEGAINFMSKEGRELIRKSEARLFGEFHPYFTKDTMMSRLDESIFGYGMFNKAEYYNRGLAMHAGISEFMHKNNIESLSKFMKLGKGTDAEKALFASGIRHGIDAANDTQFLYSVVHQSPLLTGPFSKLFLGQLMSYPINQTEFLWRSIKNDPLYFAPRWMALTGAASLATYYGAGVVVKGLGGGAMLPVAADMWKEGHEKDAVWAAAGGVLGFLPDDYALKRGLTPANGALIDTFNVLAAYEKGDEAEITKATASMARSWATVIPAFVTARKIAEGLMTQIQQEGRRFEPGSVQAGAVGSAMEATGVIPAFNSLINSYLGGGIPGLPTEITGRLAQKETVGETIKTSIGLRSREAELRTRDVERMNAERNATISGRAEIAGQMALAMEKKDTAAFQQIVQQAIKGGMVRSPGDLKVMLSHALKARSMPKQARIEERMPKVDKLRLLREEIERRKMQ
jgi:hypothetical protein